MIKNIKIVLYFVNFDNITYSLKGEKLDINENSLVHFDADYFSYYEFEKGQLLYKYCLSVTDTFKIKVGTVEYTYDELLKLLGLRSDYPDFEGIDNLPTLPVSLDGTLCVMPTEEYEGFYIAKIRRLK